MPVLYIPGNAGSGKQVRSMGSQSARDFEFLASAPGAVESQQFVFYAVDFADELTAMSGSALAAQMRFVKNCVQKILGLTREAWLRRGKRGRLPSSVVLVGHSMGGIVARGVLALPSYIAGTVETVVTISSPHSNLPAYVDPSLRSQLNAINTFWRDGLIVYPLLNSSHRARAAPVPDQVVQAHARLGQVALASIAGGRRDLLVPTRAADVRGFCPPSNGCAWRAQTEWRLSSEWRADPSSTE
jgi:GPI inositol-deacylase